jgi:uncharacterized membrane protein YeiB
VSEQSPPVPAPVRRIAGIDVARGLAVVGMISAHLTFSGAFTWPDPTTWPSVAAGRASLLFALVAGLSLGLMSVRAPSSRAAARRARVAIAVRAALVLLIGIALCAVPSGPAIILVVYAPLFWLLLTLVRARMRTLVVIATAAVLVAPIASAVLHTAGVLGPASVGPGPGFLGTLWGHVTAYDWPMYLAAMLVGLAVGRSDLRSRTTALRVVLVGVVAAVVGNTAGVVIGGPVPDPVVDPATGVLDISGGVAPWSPAGLFSTVPHSGSFVEAVGSIGFALAVLGICLLAGATRAGAALTWPIAAVGAMPLTLYVLHVASFVVVGQPEFGMSSWAPWAGLTEIVLAVVVAVTWRRLIGTGPLERGVSWIVRRAADAEAHRSSAGRPRDPGDPSGPARGPRNAIPAR